MFTELDSIFLEISVISVSWSQGVCRLLEPCELEIALAMGTSWFGAVVGVFGLRGNIGHTISRLG